MTLFDILQTRDQETVQRKLTTTASSSILSNKPEKAVSRRTKKLPAAARTLIIKEQPTEPIFELDQHFSNPSSTITSLNCLASDIQPFIFDANAELIHMMPFEHEQPCFSNQELLITDNMTVHMGGWATMASPFCIDPSLICNENPVDISAYSSGATA
jgi:hypothetical protein